MGEFGPEYHKINTLWKRDQRGVIQPGQWSREEFAFLADLPWIWTEKVDGTNIRLHWNGHQVTIGGRTDRAQVPAKLVSNLAKQLDAALWYTHFSGADDVTVYGEGYGAGIQSGGQYDAQQRLVVFDVRIDETWLKPEDVSDIADKLDLPTVPLYARDTLNRMDSLFATGQVKPSEWPGARIEGVVGRPEVDLYDRSGHRIITKVKVKDYEDLKQRGVSNG